MKTDAEKAEIREALGVEYFARLERGICPYCSAPLTREVPAEWLAYPERPPPPDLSEHVKVCVPCKSVWSDVVHSAAGDATNAVDEMRRRWRSHSKKNR